MDTEGKEYLSSEEIAMRLGLEESTFLKMVHAGKLPQGMLVTGGKLKKWKRADVAGIAYMLEVMATRMRKSTDDEQEKDTAHL